MGEIKYQKEIKQLFKKSPVISYKSIERLVKSKKSVKQYPKQLVRNLLLKQRIKKLTKGCYTILSDPSLVVFCFKPAYLGLQDALSFHDLWEQETIPVVLTARKIVPGIRKVFGGNVLIRRVNRRYLFGYNYFLQNKIYFPYSDIEKTFIDMIYFKENLNKETIRVILKRMDMNKLNAYLKKYPKRIQKIVLKHL